MSVAKVIEIIAEGDSLEDATENALAEASKTVDNIRNLYVDDYRAVIKNGAIDGYRIHTKVTFVLNE